ncbi:MAG: hypothetical protein FWE35_24285, partial [Streptosporangiales bacterium]|nr:hypothetical protein [Streptosporangiales bacterium]
VDLADRLDLAPELRMACYSFREEFGNPPTVVWRVPGTVTLLADGTGARMTVATPWGAIAVAVPRSDGVIELVQMERPGQRSEVRAGSADDVPAWVGHGLTGARTGASILVSTELPAGTGVGATAAVETAVRHCLGDCAAGKTGVTDAARASSALGVPSAALGNWRLPLDLDSAELRLVVIDTRIRSSAVSAQREYSSLDTATAAIAVGDMETFGGLLTAAHRARPCNRAQELAVAAALRAGAIGARSITDGPGRPALALVPVNALPAVRAEVASTFARYSLRGPRLLTFTPAG